MVDTCRIRRVLSSEPDPTTGVDVPTYGPTVYVGPCKVQQSRSQPRDVESGSSTAVLTLLEVHIPASAATVHAGDFIELMDGATPTRSFRADSAFRKTWQTAQRIPVTEVS